MAVLCGMPKRSATGICAQALFTSCIRRGLVSRDSMVIGCLRLSDVSVICRVVNPHRRVWKYLGVCSMYGLYWPGE